MLENIDDYQVWTRSTAIYTDNDYPVLGLAEEAGEVLGKFAKWKRDDTEFPTEAIVKELGDVMWMVARIADDMHIPMSEVLQTNKDKLDSRKQRDVLQGSGDNR